VNRLARSSAFSLTLNQVKCEIKSSREQCLPERVMRQQTSEKKSEHTPTDGDLWLGHSQNGRSLHARSRSRTLGGSRYAHAGIARTKQHKIKSHWTGGWDFFDKKSNKIKDEFAEWCPWRESNPHSLRNTILSRARLPVPPHGPRAGLLHAGTAKLQAEFDALGGLASAFRIGTLQPAISRGPAGRIR
jgi:hypothetical protein